VLGDDVAHLLDDLYPLGVALGLDRAPQLGDLVRQPLVAERMDLADVVGGDVGPRDLPGRHRAEQGVGRGGGAGQRVQRRGAELLGQLGVPARQDLAAPASPSAPSASIASLRRRSGAPSSPTNAANVSRLAGSRRSGQRLEQLAPRAGVGLGVGDDLAGGGQRLGVVPPHAQHGRGHARLGAAAGDLADRLPQHGREQLGPLLALEAHRRQRVDDALQRLPRALRVGLGVASTGSSWPMISAGDSPMAATPSRIHRTTVSPYACWTGSLSLMNARISRPRVGANRLRFW
jgi:hypothetical protein